MFAPRIMELEQQLQAANDSVARLTLANTTLTSQLEDAEIRNKKLRRNSRRDEGALKDQLLAAQTRRG